MPAVKNKPVTYLMICAVVAVWGVIFYRIFDTATTADSQLSTPTQSIQHEAYDRYTAKQDTTKLLLNYRDPFLEAVKAPLQTLDSIPKKQHAPAVHQPVPAVINWPAVKYAGYMTNPKTHRLVTILVVNDQERMLAEGESFAGVKLLKNKRDSILLRWQGKQKHIKP